MLISSAGWDRLPAVLATVLTFEPRYPAGPAGGANLPPVLAGRKAILLPAEFHLTLCEPPGGLPPPMRVDYEGGSDWAKGREGARFQTRLLANQPVWVLVGPDRTLLCARHALHGLLVLSWTTRDELIRGVEELEGQAPPLFASHVPEQRPLQALLETADRLNARLRVDGFVVEEL